MYEFILHVHFIQSLIENAYRTKKKLFFSKICNMYVPYFRTYVTNYSNFLLSYLGQVPID